MTDFQQVLNLLKTELEPVHFECHPFKIGWYNAQVNSRFQLDYDKDTFAVLVLNTPLMFENLFLPYLFRTYKDKSNLDELLKDPIDECMNHTFDNVKKNLEELVKSNNADIQIEIIKDYEVAPDTRRAKILMQTCAHISGAAYYYDSKRIQADNDTAPKKNLMGVCLHPKYGGWFAMRCVFIFKNLLVSEEKLSYKEPVDLLQGNADKILDLIHKFNYNWKDSTYRDVIDVEHKYSDMQLEYFLLEPKLRTNLMVKWLEFPNHKAFLNDYERKSNEKKNKEFMFKNFYVD